ncbi:MAG: DMT family protein [Bacteroidetes bacterium]|nr:DMT family protein [Bacteroidota bacterium]
MKGLYTILLLLLSNSFMTLAWYGHLRFFGKNSDQNSTPLWIIILLSWGIAFFEYCFQVPANRIGSSELGGPFSLLQLKVIQEVITLIVFVIFSVIAFKNVQFTMNHLIAFILLVGAVYFIFKK